MPKERAPREVMLDLTTGHWIARLTYVAAKLKLADLLKAGARTIDELATATNVQAPALYRVLRALASVGIFAETLGQVARPSNADHWRARTNKKGIRYSVCRSRLKDVKGRPNFLRTQHCRRSPSVIALAQPGMWFAT